MRNFTVLDFPQHLDDNVTPNPEWVKARLGRITGTGANSMLAVPKKAGEGMRVNLTVQLALERMTGRKTGKDFQSDAMRDGLQLEPQARFAYEKHTGRMVLQAGFLSHTDMMAGASIDGYINDFEGLLSIKCPYASTHWDIVKNQTIELAYMRQIIHEQWLTGAQWTDFVSYCESFDDPLRLKVIRVPRNDDAIRQHDAAVRTFLTEVDAALQSMRALAGGIGAVLQEAVA